MRECVCASSACHRPVTHWGADCVGRCCFMCLAQFYDHLVLYTTDIKPVVQSCLEKVRRGTCGVIFFCISLSHITELLSCCATKTVPFIFFGRRNLWKHRNVLQMNNSLAKSMNLFVGNHHLYKCRCSNAFEDKLFLKLMLWWGLTGNRKDKQEKSNKFVCLVSVIVVS